MADNKHPLKLTSPSDETDYSYEGSSVAILDEATDTLIQYYGKDLFNLTIERLVVGVFFVGVKLSNGAGGVAYSPPEVVKNAGRRILKENHPLIRGMSAAEVAKGNAPGPFSGIIRLATLNALSVPFFDGGHYEVRKESDLSDTKALFKNRRVCMVGAIIPLLKRLKELEPAEVIIIDRKEATQAEAEAGYGRFVSPKYTAESLAYGETAVFTGAAIANGSIQELIGYVPADAAIAIVGPTAGFVPEPLFRRNVALVGTVAVTESDLALDILAEGGGGYRLFNSCVNKINIINTDRMRYLGLDKTK
ncbi:MAG: hypothetical protein JW927_18015 [Deltaproteobacteria bacterium]|nr:hypothetical protein [Deltaproteobacteria bacterium]